MIIKKELDFAGKKLTFETGKLAEQANLAVKVTYGETVVLAAATSGGLNKDLDYFPLRVEYEERLYASGSIKSSRFVKREGRPTDDAIVTRRLIDHAIRPLFPAGFKDEVQVAMTILSLDPEVDPALVSMIAAAAVLHASDIPWSGPMVTAKVGFSNDDYILNPSIHEAHKESELDMMVSFCGDDMKFLAIECEANILPEKKILGAIEHARNSLKPLLDMMNDFAKEVGKEKYEYEVIELPEEVEKSVEEIAKSKLMKVFESGSKKEDVEAVTNEIMEELTKKYEENYDKSDLSDAVWNLKKKVIKELVLEKGKRADGRGMTEVRSIETEVGILPRTHGSGLFTRGSTQVLTVATLGNPTSELLIQDVHGERTKRYIHYYSFPPYSTGEVGRFGGAGGREIGHGMLAEKALVPVIPTQEEFPYMAILMSETLSSNGSSSMASACASTLALMDAGVPIKDMVAGISVGLMADVEKDKYELMTDIIGLEDGAGYMDFKIAGTKDGVTAIQLDVKLQGIPMDLLPKIFEQSREARLQILEIMQKTIKEPRTELSKYAPRMITIKIDPSQIGQIIGSGGKTIKEIQETTGAELGIEDDGTIFIMSQTPGGAEQAVEIIEGMVRELEVGEVFEGEVTDILDFGALVKVLPGKIGLLHVSELSNDYVENVSDFVSVGDTLKVKVIEVGREGKFSLSKRALEEGYDPESSSRPSRGRGNRNNSRDDRRNDRRSGGRDRNNRDRGRNRR